MNSHARWQLEVQTSEDLTGAGGSDSKMAHFHVWQVDEGRWQEASSSVGLIECPHNLAAVFTKSGWYKESKGGAGISFYYRAFEVTLSFLQMSYWLYRSCLFIEEGTTQKHGYSGAWITVNLLRRHRFFLNLPTYLIRDLGGAESWIPTQMLFLNGSFSHFETTRKQSFSYPMTNFSAYIQRLPLTKNKKKINSKESHPRTSNLKC